MVANRASTDERVSFHHRCVLPWAAAARSCALALPSAMEVFNLSRWLSSFTRFFSRAADATSSVFFDRAARYVSCSDNGFMLGLLSRRSVPEGPGALARPGRGMPRTCDDSLDERSLVDS